MGQTDGSSIFFTPVIFCEIFLELEFSRKWNILYVSIFLYIFMMHRSYITLKYFGMNIFKFLMGSVFFLFDSIDH